MKHPSINRYVYAIVKITQDVIANRLQENVQSDIPFIQFSLLITSTHPQFRLPTRPRTLIRLPYQHTSYPPILDQRLIKLTSKGYSIALVYIHVARDYVSRVSAETLFRAFAETFAIKGKGWERFMEGNERCKGQMVAGGNER